MAGTRSSARQAEKGQQSSPPSSAAKSNASVGTKRKASAEDHSSSPSATKAKRGRPSKASKEQAPTQKTLEETIANNDDNDDDDQDTEMNDAEETVAGDQKQTDANHKDAGAEVNDEGKEKSKQNEESKNGTNGANAENGEQESNDTNGNTAFDHVKADEGDDGKTSKVESTDKNGNDAEGTDNAVQEDKKREEALPSNILEKGIIYFFTRGRVGVEDPDSVQDVARSYFVMRPLPDGAKITDGAIQDLKNNRLLALPKKVWPKSGKDRFMVFVEKAQTTNNELKEEFFSGSEYSTKTVGTRQTPDVTPLGEGVYAMTSTGGGQGTTHLAYMLTIPETLGEVQKDVGLAAKGSFVVSLKNPEVSGPANAQLPQSPDYPKEFIDEFRGRGWMPAHPKHLDYANAQMLLIGENFDDSSNLDANPQDEKDEKKITPEEELKQLEEEDESRVTNLKGDDTIFADLEISSKEYPKIKTTW